MRAAPILLLLSLPLAFSPPPAAAQGRRGGVEIEPAPGDSMRGFLSKRFEIFAPTDEDLRSANHELRFAIGQFERYIGDTPRAFALLVFRSPEDARRYDASRFTKRGMAVLRRIQPPAGQAGHAGDPPLSHETAHLLFRAYVDLALDDLAAKGERSAASAAAAGNDGAPAPAAAGGTRHHSGHDLMPDWFEEALAALCERPPLQQKRLDFLRARLDRRVPLATLFTMPQPEPPAAGAGGGRTRGAQADAEERAAIYSAQALSLIRFVAEREGDRFVGKVAEALIRGRTFGDALNASQHLLSKPEALEKQWLEWVTAAGRTP